jgi:hypothetical protein
VSAADEKAAAQYYPAISWYDARDPGCEPVRRRLSCHGGRADASWFHLPAPSGVPHPVWRPEALRRRLSNGSPAWPAEFMATGGGVERTMTPATPFSCIECALRRAQPCQEGRTPMRSWPILVAVCAITALPALARQTPAPGQVKTPPPPGLTGPTGPTSLGASGPTAGAGLPFLVLAGGYLLVHGYRSRRKVGQGVRLA